MRRERFFYWMKKRVARVPEAACMPRYMIALRCLLFPKYLLLFLRGSGPVRYDFLRDCVIVDGASYSMELLREWRESHHSRFVKQNLALDEILSDIDLSGI